MGNAPGDSEWEGRKVLEVAAEQSVPPGQFLFEDHASRWSTRTCGSAPVTRTHNGEICDDRYPTYFPSHWVRERDFRLEQAIRMMTAAEAECYGILDRGSLTEGRAADVVVSDLETVKDGRMRHVYDRPAGGRRLRSDSQGIDYVIVNGTIIRDADGDVADSEGPLPGKVLREFAAHSRRPAPVSTVFIHCGHITSTPVPRHLLPRPPTARRSHRGGPPVSARVVVSSPNGLSQ